MRKLLMLATCALVASLLLAPTVGAQEMMDDSMMMEEPKMMMEEPKMMMEEPKMMEMPKTGGVVAPSTLILPAAAALLLGSGLVAYGIQRRRR